MEEIKRLLTEDAPFHVARKIPDIEISVLHSACSCRQGSPKTIFPDLVKYLIQVSLQKINVIEECSAFTKRPLFNNLIGESSRIDD